MKRIFNTLLFCLLLSTTAFAQVTDILTGLQFPFDAALDGNDLYVAELGGDRIFRIDITDPIPPTIDPILTGLGNPASLTVEGDILYYSESNFNRISSLDLSQTNPTPEVVVNLGGFRPDNLFVDGDFMYISAGQQNQLVRINLTDATPTAEVVASIPGYPLGIAKFGDDLYVSVFLGGSVVKVDITQTPAEVTTVTTGFTSTAGVTVNGGFLYVAEAARVTRLDLNATSPMPEVVVSTGISGSRNVAFDGVDLYITQTGGGGSNGSLSKLTIATPAFSTLANVCQNEMPTMLTGGSPSSGVYAGPGVTDNGDGSTFSFDPATAGGLGTYTITYTLGGQMASSTLTVVEVPTVTFSTGGLSVQVDAGVQTGLSGGMPAGGVYSGNGVTDDGNGMTYSFDPAAAGEGENVITYTFSDANGCGGEQGAIITVTPAIPAGDNCGIAIDLNSLFGQTPGETQTSEAYDNAAYNDDPSDPNENVCFGDWEDFAVESTWFSFTGDGSTYTIESTGDFDPFITLYTGGCEALTEVTCNDDTDGLNFSIEIETEAGVEYQIYVGRASTLGTSTLYNLEVTRAILPGEQCDIAIDINNLFGQAAMVPQASDTYDNYADYDTDDTDIVPSCFLSLQPGTGTIWFSFTGDGNRYTINSANNSSNNELGGIVYTGPCDMRTELSCNVTIGQPNFSIDLQTEAGVEYTIMVAEASANQTESFNLEVTNQTTTSVQDIRNTEFNVYPNPTNGWVQLDGFTADRIEVLDQLGRTVRTQAQAGTGVDLSGLPAGVYVLRMQAEEQVISAKVVKE
ncbi:MAG: T9SS type A sorting domain-containing protein [Bacteroidota bacterium]